MLLLCFQGDNDVFNDEIFKNVEYRHVRISSLLSDMRIGEVKKAKARPVLQSAYSNQPEDSPVVMLKMSHFTEDNERIDWNAVAEEMELQDQLSETEVIDRSSILQPEDLLVNLRGQTRVIRITDSMIDDMPVNLVRRRLRFTASNNFVIMRPNPLIVHSPFLHILLDILLEDVWSEWHKVQQNAPSDNPMYDYLKMKFEERGTANKSPGLPLGLRDLKEVWIDIPIDAWIQKAWSHRQSVVSYNEKLVRDQKAMFRSDLRKYINPNIIP